MHTISDSIRNIVLNDFEPIEVRLGRIEYNIDTSNMERRPGKSKRKSMKKVVFLIRKSAEALILEELGDVLTEHEDEILIKVISDEDFERHMGDMSDDLK
jgi:hypothetical protein